MFIRYNPAEQIERLRAEFHESRARVWEDESVPWEKRSAEVERSSAGHCESGELEVCSTKD
jgi:hypothetical protein